MNSKAPPQASCFVSLSWLRVVRMRRTRIDRFESIVALVDFKVLLLVQKHCLWSGHSP